MNKDRLLLLADFLEKLPPEKFDYSEWVGRKWDGNPDLMACGTTACALGWATCIPELRALGLELDREDHRPYVRRRDGVLTILADICAVIFDISDGDARYLFVPRQSGLGASASAKDVAAHIRRFVESEP